MPPAALTHRRWIARAIARALLADAEQPGARWPHALQARAAAALGERPDWLVELVTALGPPARGGTTSLRWPHASRPSTPSTPLSPTAPCRACGG